MNSHKNTHFFMGILLFLMVNCAAQRNETGYCAYITNDYIEACVIFYEDNHYDIVLSDDRNSDVVSVFCISQGTYQVCDNKIQMKDKCYFPGLEMEATILMYDTLVLNKAPHFLTNVYFRKIPGYYNLRPYYEGGQGYEYDIQQYNSSHPDSIPLSFGSYVFDGWTSIILTIYDSNRYTISYNNDFLLSSGSYCRDHNALKMKDDFGFSFNMFIGDNTILYKHRRFYPMVVYPLEILHNPWVIFFRKKK